VCGSSNHWSDDVTSIAWVEDIFVPYIKEAIEDLRQSGIDVLPFGDQKAVLIVDTWWGWLHPKFREHLCTRRPWIRLVFVPGRCTPKFQPLDLGIIIIIKALVRAAFSAWVAALTVMQLAANGNDPTAVSIPFEQQPVIQKLTALVSLVYVKVNGDATLQAKLSHAWDKTGLSRAWDVPVQREAVAQASRLFKGSAPGVDCGAPTDDCEDEIDAGSPFDQREEPDEEVGEDHAEQANEMNAAASAAAAAAGSSASAGGSTAAGSVGSATAGPSSDAGPRHDTTGTVPQRLQPARRGQFEQIPTAPAATEMASEVFAIELPAGVEKGTMVQFKLPDGRTARATVPDLSIIPGWPEQRRLHVRIERPPPSPVHATHTSARNCASSTSEPILDAIIEAARRANIDVQPAVSAVSVLQRSGGKAKHQPVGSLASTSQQTLAAGGALLAAAVTDGARS
jgi:hypothetical protein